MEKLEIVRNKSLTYILPVFGLFVPISFFRLLKNTYLWYDDFKEESFCLLYKFDGRVKGEMRSRQGFTVYEEKTLKRSKYFNGSVDYGEHVVFQFLLPDEMFDLRNLFIEGMYSKFSDDHKRTILEFILRYYGPNEQELIRRIFDKDIRLREELMDKLGPKTVLPLEAELSSIPDEKNELFLNSLVIKTEKNENTRIL